MFFKSKLKLSGANDISSFLTMGQWCASEEEIQWK